VNAGEVQLEIAVEQQLGGVRFLGAAGDGRFFVIVNERARVRESLWTRPSGGMNHPGG